MPISSYIHCKGGLNRFSGYQDRLVQTDKTRIHPDSFNKRKKLRGYYGVLLSETLSKASIRKYCAFKNRYFVWKAFQLKFILLTTNTIIY